MVHNIPAGAIDGDVQRPLGSLACLSTLEEPGGSQITAVLLLLSGGGMVASELRDWTSSSILVRSMRRDLGSGSATSSCAGLVDVLTRGLHDLVEMACHSARTTTTSSALDIRDCIVMAPVAERSERRFGRVIHKAMLAAFLLRKGDSRGTRDVSLRRRGTRGAGGKHAASCRLRIPGRI